MNTTLNPIRRLRNRLREKTPERFLGNSQDRRVLQQHLALVRLFCKIPQYSPFETCVAIRVGWVPGIDSMDDDPPNSKANMMVVGLSLGILGLVYVFAVLVYLRIRRQQISKRKSHSDQEACIPKRDDDSDKASTHTRIETSKRLELYHTTSMGRRKIGSDPWSQMSSIVETYNQTWTDRMGQHGCEFKAQDFQLQPEFFEPEFMASPPQQVLEYLERLQNSVTFARHRLRSCYRYQPTLIGIPEDDYFYQELEKVRKSPSKEKRTTPDGGSASSMASLLEIEEGPKEEKPKKEKTPPKIPPRKPQRKTVTKTKVEINHDALKSSEQEQKEIQNAMNTLNETLDALEYDIYKHDLMHQISDPEHTNPSRSSSREGELDDFDTSSCSSLSAVTVLGRDNKKNMDINSTGSRSVERNLSEEFSTFSNSTYSIGSVMPGLFAQNNTSDDIERSPDGAEDDGCQNQGTVQATNKDQNCQEEEPRLNYQEEKQRLNCQEEKPKSNCQEEKPKLNCQEEKPRFSLPQKDQNEKLPSQFPNKLVTCTVKSFPPPIEKTTAASHSLSTCSEESSATYSESSDASSVYSVKSNNTAYSVKSSKPSKTSTAESSRNHTPVSSASAAASPSGDETKPSMKQSSKCHGHKRSNIPSGSDQNDPSNKRSDKRHLLIKSSSTESMTTISTDMTTDSLESCPSSPNLERSSLSPTPSLVDMWISKLIQNSIPYSKSRRKFKKKLVLPENEVDNWEHVCQKHKDPCPMHDLKDVEPNLIDKLAHYSSKTMAGKDVAGYFQSLKQDVLKEHLKSWLLTNGQVKKHRKGISVKYKSKESSHKKPLVPVSQDTNSVCDSATNTNWTSFHKSSNGTIAKDHSNNTNGHCSINSTTSTTELIDSLDSENTNEMSNASDTNDSVQVS
ncbi:hypothetical protein HNY73_017694 [Argiope bruennichi]|uniref:Uncharacterized protein n=1 Tax=Argiope bruennichi TaxID=94029 RepID=A0A8T0EEI2_ARGBR|nr:hypothetical protein HNY73_017694 [Argiope bruennichi]